MAEEQKPRKMKARDRKKREAVQEVTRLFPEDLARRQGAYREDMVPSVGRKDEDGDTRHRGYVRIGRRWTEINERVRAGEYTWPEFVAQLDPEELVRGQLRDSNGEFMGRPPTFIPRAFFLACVQEIKRRFDEKMQERLLTAADELIELSKPTSGMKPKDRADVLKYLIERVVGPVPKTVELSQDEPWKIIIGDIVADAPHDVPEPYADRRASLLEGMEGNDEEDED